MEIQQPKDPGYLNDFEKKHIPNVKLPKKIEAEQEIKIKVKEGEIGHPMIPEHYIIWIALYDGEQLLEKKKLSPGDEIKAEFKIKITPDMKLRVLQECNIHGIWEKEIESEI